MKNRRKILLFIALALLVIAAAVVVFSLGIHRRSYVLGVIGNFKGKNAQVGIESFNAITLAYEEYRMKNPHGFELKILPLDDSWDPAKVRSAYLNSADNVDLLLMLTSSTNIMLVYDDILARPNLLHSVLGPTTTLLSTKKDNVVRNVTDIDEEQKQIAAFINARGFKRLLLVVEDEFNPKYTGPATTYFQKYAPGCAMDIVKFSGHLMNIDSMSDMLKKNNYDALYAVVGGMPREAGILIQHARMIQKDIPVLITPWINGVVFLQSLGTQLNQIYMPSHIKRIDNPVYDGFMKAYQERYGVTSHEYFVPMMYDLSTILFESLNEAKSPRTQDLLPVMLSKRFQGILGSFRFNQYGDADSVLHFYQLVNGDWHDLR